MNIIKTYKIIKTRTKKQGKMFEKSNRRGLMKRPVRAEQGDAGGGGFLPCCTYKTARSSNKNGQLFGAKLVFIAHFSTSTTNPLNFWKWTFRKRKNTISKEKCKNLNRHTLRDCPLFNLQLFSSFFFPHNVPIFSCTRFSMCSYFLCAKPVVCFFFFRKVRI